MPNIKVLEWNEKQFAQSRSQWNSLLKNSQADPLFLSWEWQYTWWTVFANPDTMQLKLFVAIDENDNLLGIAPFYMSRIRIKKYLSVNRMQFIGNIWRGPATMRTELLSFITSESCAQEISLSFLHYINAQSDWDEVVFVDLPVKSVTFQTLSDKKTIANSYYRIAEKNDSFYLGLENTFQDYIQALGKNTRLKLFNRRKMLEEAGITRFERNTPANIEKEFELLNDFHIKRWGRPAFEGKRLEFNINVSRLMAEKESLLFSTIYVDNEPVSIQYNFACHGHEYNIQAGFLESFHKKLALGYLHFGYEIEAAYTNKLSIYDFLAGEGKNTQYKSSLTDTKIELVDLQVVRKKQAKLLYRLYDLYKKLRK